MDIDLEVGNVRSIYRSCSLQIIGRKLVKYKVSLVAVVEIREDKSGIKPADSIHFL
jgi:hypothetical protein